MSVRVAAANEMHHGSHDLLWDPKSHNNKCLGAVPLEPYRT